MLKIIRRVMSFGDWSRTHPNDPPPGDMLDAQFDEIVDRIDAWDARVRQAITDDGKVGAGKVGISALDDDFRAFLDQKLAVSVEKLRFELSEYAKAAISAEKTAFAASEIASQAAATARIEKDAILDAENRAGARIGEIQHQAARLEARLAENVDLRTDWDDAAQEAQAWTESSRLWAEHMPDTLPDNALKIMDITGDHWSSRWWANQAANAFGMLTSLYLGAHPVPPVTNNNGGPIQIGSIYYDTTTGQAYVWDGSQWQSFYGVQRAGLVTLWYAATDGQTAFPLTTPDLHGDTFTIDATTPEGIDPHVNGVKLMPLLAGSSDGDWTLSESTITFLRPLRAGDIVGIDVLMPVESLGPGAVENWKLSPLTGQDGTQVTFALTVAAGGGPSVTVNKNEELLVSLDGVIQEPTADYNASGASITFVNAPAADAQTFITWMRSSGGGGGGAGGPVDWTDITGKPSTFPPTLPIPSSGVTGLDAAQSAQDAAIAGKAATVHTHAQADVTNLVTDLAAKEPTIAAGTAAQYWRGDKSWQAFPAIPADDVIGGIITIASTAPSSPATGDVWIDTT